ncbi:transcriptional regulator [Paenalcaligenes niemegkensis]|uniref:PhaM family polyhydroxyalkanoate granule multifunctional regulatory protein n=1 Tax=Paenalcaligenes niemegkensis TaxID=2895469 RepID=UPI001EE97F43|nr:PhaM family polyhydroxyalkanoate granule multifunctional regulatory protein [Paenalcaligenes niemegkensis]MCQ9617717.1 transcriptional regulator [Paenalcaligenes niemegkensis]
MQNPFDIPGMMGTGGTSADSSKNPLFASLEMMRSAWETMGAGGFGNVADSSAAFLAPEELEKRIRDLRAVENWLKLNLSMLESTIQGLEIQKATISTVQGFAQRAAEMASASAAAASGSGSSKGAASTEDPADSAKAWWSLMQQQFEAMANATAASMQSAQAMADTMASSVADVSGDSTFTKAAAKKSAKKAASKASGASKSASAAKKTTRPSSK